MSGEGGGDLRANDVSGDIHFTAMAAKRIEAKSISGSIVLTGGNTDIEANTVSGDAHLTLGTVSRARFRTVSGAPLLTSVSTPARSRTRTETMFRS